MITYISSFFFLFAPSFHYRAKTAFFPFMSITTENKRDGMNPQKFQGIAFNDHLNKLLVRDLTLGIDHTCIPRCSLNIVKVFGSLVKVRKFNSTIHHSHYRSIPLTTNMLSTRLATGLPFFSCDRGPLGEPYHLIYSLPHALPLIPFPLPSSLFHILNSINI